MRGVQRFLYGDWDGNSNYKGYGNVSSYAYRRRSTQSGGYGTGPDYISAVTARLDDTFPKAYVACAQQWSGQGFGRETVNFTHKRQGSNVLFRDGHVSWFSMTVPRNISFMYDPAAAGCPDYYVPFCYPFDYPYVWPSSMFWGAADRMY